MAIKPGEEGCRTGFCGLPPLPASNVLSSREPLRFAAAFTSPRLRGEVVLTDPSLARGMGEDG